MKAEPSKPAQIFTVGHSNRSFDEFRLLLNEFEIKAVADVRRYPSSRKFPHFNGEALRELLNTQGIQYVWFEALGGRRHSATGKDSPNMGLDSPGFRNYADYMMTRDFQATVQELLSLCSRLSTAIMCAERFFWKCHRRLLSDFLVARGVTVAHIIDGGDLRPHALTSGATIADGGIPIYPSPDYP